MTSWPIGFLDDVLGEIVDDFEIDVRFEQRGADVAAWIRGCFLR